MTDCSVVTKTEIIVVKGMDLENRKHKNISVEATCVGNCLSEMCVSGVYEVNTHVIISVVIITLVKQNKQP